jgi:hypothetical protein
VKARASLSALKALNAARLSSTRSAAEIELAIDAADRACGYDRSKNRPVRGPLPPLTHVRGNQTFNGRAGRSWPHQPSCLCMVCGNLRRARLRKLVAAASGGFDVRPLLELARRNPSRISNGSIGGAT